MTCFLSVRVEAVVVRSVACYRSISPSATNLIIGSIAGAILVAAIVLGGTGWGFKRQRLSSCYGIQA
ncbi:unnamed protein product [Boreogadus saida]